MLRLEGCKYKGDIWRIVSRFSSSRLENQAQGFSQEYWLCSLTWLQASDLKNIINVSSATFNKSSLILLLQGISIQYIKKASKLVLGNDFVRKSYLPCSCNSFSRRNSKICFLISPLEQFQRTLFMAHG